MAGGWGQNNLARFQTASDNIYKGGMLKQQGLKNLQESLGQIAEMGFTGYQNRKQRDLAREMPGITSMAELRKKIGERAQTARELGQDVGEPTSYLEGEVPKEKGFLEGLLPNVTGQQPAQTPGAPAQTVPFTAADQPAAIADLQKKYGGGAEGPAAAAKGAISTTSAGKSLNQIAADMKADKATLVFRDPEGKTYSLKDYEQLWINKDPRIPRDWTLPKGWAVQTGDYVPAPTEVPVREGEEPPTQAKDILNRWGYAASDKEAPAVTPEASLIPAEKKNQWGEVLAAEKYAESPEKAAERSMQERYPNMDKKSAEYERLFMRTLRGYAPLPWNESGGAAGKKDDTFAVFPEFGDAFISTRLGGDIINRYFDSDGKIFSLKKDANPAEAKEALSRAILSYLQSSPSGMSGKFTETDVRKEVAEAGSNPAAILKRINTYLDSALSSGIRVASTASGSTEFSNTGTSLDSIIETVKSLGPLGAFVNAVSAGRGMVGDYYSQIGNRPPQSQQEFDLLVKTTDVGKLLSSRGVTFDKLAAGIKAGRIAW